MLLKFYIYILNFPGVKVPISILGAEIDKMSPPELLNQFEDVLAAKPEVERNMHFFPHGTSNVMLNWFVG